MDKARADLKNTNVRLKDTVNQVPELNFFKFSFASILFCPVLEFWLDLIQVLSLAAEVQSEFLY